MTRITIDTDIKLSKTHFKNVEELQEALLLIQHEDFELSIEQEKMLKQREEALDAAESKGRPWREVLTDLKK